MGLLSERGKNIFFPKKGILVQTADAKGKNINATIGAAIEDDGSPMRLSAVENQIKIAPELSFPYAPSFGRPDLRKQWQTMIRAKNPGLGEIDISLPVVTNALTHGLSMIGYLFADPDQEIIIPDLYWGNYNLIFTQAYHSMPVSDKIIRISHSITSDIWAIRVIGIRPPIIALAVKVMPAPGTPFTNKCSYRYRFLSHCPVDFLQHPLFQHFYYMSFINFLKRRTISDN